MKRAVKMEENLEVRILEGDDKKWRSEAVTKRSGRHEPPEKRRKRER